MGHVTLESYDIYNQSKKYALGESNIIRTL